MKRAAAFIRELLEESVQTSWSLYRVMIPTILVLKGIDELGGITYLSHALNPLMSVVGLPSELGIVWATALLVNIYSALIVLVNLNLDLSVAQVSVLGSMILLAHSIPVEGTIARQAGVSLWSTVSVRVGGSLIFGFLLHHLYETTGTHQQTAQILWQQSSHPANLMEWALGQIQNLAIIYTVITLLMLVLKILKKLGIETLMAAILSPFLKLLGISRAATNLTIIGMTLGLSYGGGIAD
ncbi:hypothetical protein [Endozoicomonas lisbonensis]|uniref:hypothetical protein n=1 Tax=Endozoicomonas lisbonensis TaxID=3120522 RepID=UPI003394D426